MLFVVHPSSIRKPRPKHSISINTDAGVDQALAMLNVATLSDMVSKTGDGWELYLRADHGIDASRLAQVVRAINKVGKLEWLEYRCAVTGQFSLFTDALVEGGSDLKTACVYVGRGFEADSDELCPTPDNLAAISDTLACFPQLECLVIPFYQEVAGLTAWKVALPAINRPSNLLKHVVIEHRGPRSNEGKEDIGLFLEACKGATNLVNLEICGHGYGVAFVEEEHLPLVAQLLDPQILPNLTNLTLSCATDRGRLVPCLKSNRKLQELIIGTDAIVRPGRNISDLSYSYRWEDFHVEEIKSFRELLRSENFSITDLAMYPWNYDCNDQPELPDLQEDVATDIAAIRFFLKLNRGGRYNLIGPGNTAGKSEWIDTIGRWQNESHSPELEKLSGVFYYLQHNPSLCKGNTGLHRLKEQPEGIDLETQTFRVLVSGFARLAAKAAGESLKRKRECDNSDQSGYDDASSSSGSDNDTSDDAEGEEASSSGDNESGSSDEEEEG